jgi:AsmA protein
MAPEGATIQNITLVAPSVGELSGSGSISPSHALDFKMRATLAGSTLAGSNLAGSAVLGALGKAGTQAIPFLIEGTSADPIFRPDVKSLAAQQVHSLPKGNLGKTAAGVVGGILGKKRK